MIPSHTPKIDLQNALRIPGFMEEAELRWLAEQAATHPRIVEIGSWLGRSARALADHCPGLVYCVDDWRGPVGLSVERTAQYLGPEDAYERFSANLADLIEAGKIVRVRQASLQAAGNPAFSPQSLDLVFIDGDHAFDAVLADVHAWLPLLKDDGLLCGHDFGPAWPGVPQAVRELLPGFGVVPGTSIWFIHKSAIHTTSPKPKTWDRRLFIATPVYDSVKPGFVISLVATTAALLRAGLDFYFCAIPGDALVTRARNIAVARFLAGDWTDLLFLDADLEWSPRSLLRLLQAGEHHPAVCGVYPKKTEVRLEFPMVPAEDKAGRMERCPECGAIELAEAPAGFLLLQRGTLQRMLAAYPELRCELSPKLSPAEQQYSAALFDTAILDGRYKSEDFVFSRRWRALGGRLWALPDLPLIHHGCKEFTGTLAEQMLSVHEESTQEDEDENRCVAAKL